MKLVCLDLHSLFLFLPEPVDALAGATIINRKIERKIVIQTLENQQYIPLIDFLCSSNAFSVFSEGLLLNAFMTSISLYFSYA
jgi:hypothetical protein